MTDTANPEFLKAITSFYFSCGGFFGGYSDVLIEKTENGAEINVEPSTLSYHDITETAKELSVGEWQDFLDNVFTKCRLGEWEAEYYRLALDGTQWNIKIKLDSGNELEYHGSNDYPPNWGGFIDCINDLISFSGVRF